jgi:hypothetical protein
MTDLMRHTWLQRSFAAFAIAALLFTAGSSPASAKKEVPQDISKAEFKEFCELAGGLWQDYGAGGASCIFDGWYMDCNGSTCLIDCFGGTRCIDERTASSTLREASLQDDQKVVETNPTPTPGSRGRDRRPNVDQPIVVAPLSTATPESTKPVAPVTEPVRG